MGDLVPDSLFFFLPHWPPGGSAVLWVSLTIVLAGLIGEIAYRRFLLPRVVGYALVGTVIASFGLGIAGSGINPSLRLIVDLALALLLFELGCRIDLSWLRRNPWLLATSLAEAALTFVVVRTALVWAGLEPQAATPAAAIAIATSPAVVMRVASEFRASGQVTERLIVLSGLNTLYAVLATKFVLGWLHAEYLDNSLVALLHPGYLLAGSALVAALLAGSVALIARKLDLKNENSTLLLIGLILLALAVTRMANLSTLMVPLLAGMILRNSSPRPWIWPRHFGTAGGALVLLLFVVTGSVWSLDALATGLLAGLVLIAARAFAKLAAVLAFGRPSGISTRQAVALGVALTPISGSALVLMAEMQAVYPIFTASFSAVILSSIAVLELAGPIAVHLALRYTREAHQR
jgi:Kef-type K+ transport system membrane component KefB